MQSTRVVPQRGVPPPVLPARTPPATRILIVEDEPAIAESLDYALQREGFETQTAATYARAEQARAWPTLIILDLMLPDGNGRDLLRTLRAEARATPVIVLSSRESESDRVSALEDGADDYVTKPFSPREVVARVRAVLRRLTAADPAEATPGIGIDRKGRQASFAGRSLELTRVEFDLLATLWESRGQVYTRAELIDRVWGSGFVMTDRTIDSHIKSLRRKLEGAGASAAVIQTVRGVGYRLAANETVASETAAHEGPASETPASEPAASEAAAPMNDGD
jgi:DNA-binding response OmpR family regulator